MKSLLTACRVCAPGRDALLSALVLPVKDFEDAVQVVNAQEEALDALITATPDDYKGVSFPIFSLDDFLKRLARI